MLKPLRKYYLLYKELTKSGITFLVLITTAAGYLVGHSFQLPFSSLHFILTLTGTALLAAGSAAWNQYQEQKLDAKMQRTARRPLPSERMSQRAARLLIGTHLASGLGFLYLAEPKVFLLGLFALISYNGLYTLWWKPKWAYAAIPGSIPGALPILMGFTAATGIIFSPEGIYLFLILVFWQMPHFWALAIKYRDDYERGGIPTLPVSRGQSITLHQIGLWTFSYIGLLILGPIFLNNGLIYISITALALVKLLWEFYRFLQEPEQKGWLKFFLWVNFSLIFVLFAAVLDHWSYHLFQPFFV